MKSIFYLITIIIELLLLYYIRLQGHLYFGVLLFGVVLSINIIIIFSKEGYSEFQKNLAWGFLYGSCTSIAIIILTVIYFLMNALRC